MSDWTKVRIGDALTLINGRAFKPSEWSKTGLPIVRIQNLNNPAASFNYFEGALPRKWLLDDGDLLFAWSGTPGTSFGAHIWRGGQAWLNQHIFKVDFNAAQFDKHFLQLAINQNLDEYIRAAHGGAGLAHITKGRFEESELVVPPLPEQHRIVAEIEKQFTRLDAGVAALRRVQANLKRYRASVLKAACEGKLVPTEAELARAEGREYESGAALLARHGSKQSSETIPHRAGRLWGGGHVPDLTSAERASLPTGWTWSRVYDLGVNPEETVQVGPMSMRSVDFVDSGVPVLNVGCVKWSRFDESKLDHLPRSRAADFERYRIKPGDVLFTRSGTVGRCAVAKPHQDGWLMTFHLLRVRPSTGICLSAYLRHVFEGATHVRRQTKGASIGSTRAGFNTNLLGNLSVPLPPLAEQQRIVAEVERRLSVIDELEAVVSANLLRAARLRQAVLQRAFSGEL